jgi:hypothetical protein
MVPVFVTRITIFAKTDKRGHGYMSHRLGVILNAVKDFTLGA